MGVLDADLSGDSAAAGSGFAYTINSITYDGTVDTITILSSGQGYVIGDVLSAADSDLVAEEAVDLNSPLLHNLASHKTQNFLIKELVIK